LLLINVLVAFFPTRVKFKIVPSYTIGCGKRLVRGLLIPMGETNPNELSFLPKALSKTFRIMSFEISSENLNLPLHAYNSARRQYNSTILLEYLAITKPRGYEKYLGIVDADLYAGELNFVFGEATLNGDSAIISLYRLRPEFYSSSADEELFRARVLKEAVHELGHTFGLTHCRNPECVMHFSNSIMDTDLKSAEPCSACQVKLFRRL